MRNWNFTLPHGMEGSSGTKVVKLVVKFFDLCAGIVFQEQLTGICVRELLPETVQTPGGYYFNEFSDPYMTEIFLFEIGNTLLGFLFNFSVNVLPNISPHYPHQDGIRATFLRILFLYLHVYILSNILWHIIPY